MSQIFGLLHNLHRGFFLSCLTKGQERIKLARESGARRCGSPIHPANAQVLADLQYRDGPSALAVVGVRGRGCMNLRPGARFVFHAHLYAGSWATVLAL